MSTPKQERSGRPTSKRLCQLVGILLSMQALLSWVNSFWSVKGSGDPTGLAPEFGRSVGLSILTVLFWLVVARKITGTLQTTTIVIVVAELVLVGAFMILFGALQSTFFFVPILTMAAAAALTLAARRGL